MTEYFVSSYGKVLCTDTYESPGFMGNKSPLFKTRRGAEQWLEKELVKERGFRPKKLRHLRKRKKTESKA